MTAELLMLIGGCCAFALTLFWVRLRRLRMKYALAWLGLASVLLVLGAFPGILMSLAGWARLSYPALVLFIALAIIYLFAFSVTMSLSRLYRANVRLIQEVALLEARIAELEHQSDS